MLIQEKLIAQKNTKIRTKYQKESYDNDRNFSS